MLLDKEVYFSNIFEEMKVIEVQSETGLFLCHLFKHLFKLISFTFLKFGALLMNSNIAKFNLKNKAAFISSNKFQELILSSKKIS